LAWKSLVMPRLFWAAEQVADSSKWSSTSSNRLPYYPTTKARPRNTLRHACNFTFFLLALSVFNLLYASERIVTIFTNCGVHTLAYFSAVLSW
jgi:hypothetical protein